MFDVQALVTILKTTTKHEKNTYTFVLPRTDITSSVDGFLLSPAHELILELTFMPMDDTSAMLMGEIALLEDEIDTFQQQIIEQGMAITALHNHFIRETPHVMFMHFSAQGNAAQLAQFVKASYDKLQSAHTKYPLFPPTTLTTTVINNILSSIGTLTYNAYKIELERPDLHAVDQEMQLEADTWLTFQGTDDICALAGEIALTKEQVTPFTQTVIKNKLELVALHNHMVYEQPRLFFAHIWGTGTSKELARKAQAALKTLIPL